MPISRLIRRVSITSAAAAAVVLALTSCGPAEGSGGESAAAVTDSSTLPATSLTTLRTAWPYPDMALDPGTYYGSYGFTAMGGVYDSLVAYEPGGGAGIVPQLAAEWEVSPDGMRYTFTLQEGALFHDGTPVESSDVRYSLERFLRLGGAPSYMLAALESVETPDAGTVVVNLAHPVEPLLGFLASYVGPRILNEEVMLANAGDDEGSGFLLLEDAGSGPYVISEASTDNGYTLTRFDDYWGEAPAFESVEVAIIPEITNQVLALQSGDLDVIASQVPANVAQQLLADADLSATSFDAVIKTLVWVKDDGLFGDREARIALRDAIDREAITQGAFGFRGTAATGLIPPVMLADAVEDDGYTYDPSRLSELADSSDEQITIGYLRGLASDTLVAELIQAQLQSAGLDATTRGYGMEFLGFAVDPTDAPELMILSANADAVTPGAWLAQYFSTGGAATLNGASVPEGDALLSEGVRSLTAQEAQDAYLAASAAYSDSGLFIPITDLQTVLYARTAVGPVSFDAGNPFGPLLSLTGQAVR